MTAPDRPLADDIDYLTKLVRAADRPRYYATLFAPAELRADLFALYGFAAEIERIPDQVSNPTLGRIRLQWWRDSLTEPEGVEEGAGPALRAMRNAIARHALPMASLTALVEARDADLYSDPPATLADLEAGLDRTQAALFGMAAAIAGAAGLETAEAARHAGMAYGLARRLAGLAADRARGRTMLPADLLAAEGLTAADPFASHPDSRLLTVVRLLASLARNHFEAARSEHVTRRALPAFLPLAVVPPLLARVERKGAEIWESRAALSDLESLLRIGWAKLSGRV